MDIQLNEEQELLRHSVQRLLQDQYGFHERCKIVASETGWSRKHWDAIAELGLLAATLPEEFGGLGDGPLATMIIAQEFGRHLVVDPFIETAVMAGGVINAIATSAQRVEWLSDIAAGKSIWTLAWSEKASRYDLANVAVTAVREADAYVLSGVKTAVIAAPWADYLIVSARTDGDQRDRAGISLFVVDRHAAHLHLKSYRTIDGRRAAEVELDGVRVPADRLLGVEGAGIEALEGCRDRTIGALCAEAIGVMSELNVATLAYSKARKQFGVSLGSFQVLQHRLVDMFIAHEEAVSLTQHLSLTLSSGGKQVSKLASGAKAKVGANARFVGEQAIQLHGGMGMSDELAVGHYFKRLNAIDIQFGDPMFHLARYAHFA